ncbi:MAG: AMP-binding protein, partial [Pseudomonadota bacterium]
MTNPLYDALFAPHRESEKRFLQLDDGTQWRHTDFADCACRFAEVLTDAGVAPGDRVAMQVAKSPEALALFAACVQLGAVFLPLNTAYTASELDYFIGDARPRVLVVAPERASTLQAVVSAHKVTLFTLDGDGGGDLTSAAAAVQPLLSATPR